MAGFKVLWANEFVPAAQETYRANHPHSILDTRDIRTIKPEEILEAIELEQGQIDLMDGSPPCASFSTAGKREAGWGKIKKYSDTKQRTDDLFFEYARLIEGLQPKVFVAENVSGLVKGTAKGYFKQILQRLKDCGYNVKARLLNAMYLGVPQSRERIIFIGVRNDLGLEPKFPKPQNKVWTLRDAIPWIDTARIMNDTSGQYNQGDVTDKPSSTADTNPRLFIEDKQYTDISKYQIGKFYDETEIGKNHKRRFNLSKPDIDKPCPTIIQSGGHLSTASVVHPYEKRKFTIRELRRICSFPDDFILTGTYAQQWERMGRAVPPLMMRAIAETVRDEILRLI